MKILLVDDMKNNDPSQFPSLFSLPLLIQLLVILRQFFCDNTLCTFLSLRGLVLVYKHMVF